MRHIPPGDGPSTNYGWNASMNCVEARTEIREVRQGGPESSSILRIPPALCVVVDVLDAWACIRGDLTTAERG